jgi:hypothetical protein
MMMTMCWILPTGEFVIAPGGGPVTPAFTTGTGQTCAVVVAGDVGVGVAAAMVGVGEIAGAVGVVVAAGVGEAFAVAPPLAEGEGAALEPAVALADALARGAADVAGAALGPTGLGPTVAPPLHAHGNKKSASKNARCRTSIGAQYSGWLGEGRLRRI